MDSNRYATFLLNAVGYTTVGTVELRLDYERRLKQCGLEMLETRKCRKNQIEMLGY